MGNFVISFPLKTQKYQEDILDKRFEAGRRIYNSLVHITQKRYREMVKTKQYRMLIASLSDDKKQNKIIWKQIEEMRKAYGFSKYSFEADVKEMQHHFKTLLDAHTVQKIAGAVWNAYSKFFYGNGKRVYFKKYGQFHSLEGKSNASGIRFRENKIFWNSLVLPVLIDNDNFYVRYWNIYTCNFQPVSSKNNRTC